MSLRAGVCSDIGGYREVNQDAAFTASWGAGVADGVGGGPAGDLASASLVHRLIAGGPRVADATALRDRVREANWDIGAHVRRDPALSGMATTFTAIWITVDGRLLVAHTGDSRAYVRRGAALMRQTRDDSYVQLLVERGMVRAEDAMTHPRRNIITASLRGDETDAAGVTERELTLGDRWLVCSDGVSDYLPDDEIAALIDAELGPHAAAALVVDAALEAGSRDNVTAVVADVVPGAPGAERPVLAGAAALRFTEELDDLVAG